MELCLRLSRVFTKCCGLSLLMRRQFFQQLVTQMIVCYLSSKNKGEDGLINFKFPELWHFLHALCVVVNDMRCRASDGQATLASCSSMYIYEVSTSRCADCGGSQRDRARAHNYIRVRKQMHVLAMSCFLLAKYSS